MFALKKGSTVSQSSGTLSMRGGPLIRGLFFTVCVALVHVSSAIVDHQTLRLKTLAFWNRVPSRLIGTGLFYPEFIKGFDIISNEALIWPRHLGSLDTERPHLVIFAFKKTFQFNISGFLSKQWKYKNKIKRYNLIMRANINNLLKGRATEAIFEEMFGNKKRYRVLHFGFEYRSSELT